MDELAGAAESAETEQPRRGRRHRRAIVGLGLVGVVALVMAIGGLVLSRVPRNGTALPVAERLRLLEAAGLPPDFPVHPSALRNTQPPQGGLSYTLVAPVPDVLEWQHTSLVEAGYQVFSADVRGQDEYLPHWLYFQTAQSAQSAAAPGRPRTSGAIIIRSARGGYSPTTEVKILSVADARLAPPPLPPGTGRR